MQCVQEKPQERQQSNSVEVNNAIVRVIIRTNTELIQCMVLVQHGEMPRHRAIKYNHFIRKQVMLSWLEGQR